ncbi:hypothetical protein Tco_1329438 [Tanacetum coccineum]
MLFKCNNIKLVIRNDNSEVVCAMCKQYLITANHDVYVLNYVNDMNSCADNKSANISSTTNHKKHKAKVKKFKKLGSKERLASHRPRKPRTCLRWSPTRRIFNLSGKLIESSAFECQSDTFVGDNAYASNPQEPTSKWFLNSTSFLGRSLWELFALEMIMLLQFWIMAIFNLEVAFKRNTCFVRNLEGVDLLKGSRTTNFYTINLYEMTSASPICHMARATSTKFNKTPYELINDRKPDISFLYVFKALCYPKNDRDDIGKLGVKAMYDDYIGGQMSDASRTSPATPATQNLQTPNASTTSTESAPTPTDLSLHSLTIPNTSHDVDELQQQPQHVQQ